MTVRPTGAITSPGYVTRDDLARYNHSMLSSDSSRPATSDLAQVEDADLVARCAEGDQRAWSELVRRYKRLIYTIPYRMGLDPADADDVFQITFTRLSENIEKLEQPGRVRAWLVTTARRIALNLTSRTRRMEGEEVLAMVADPAELPPDEIHRLEQQQLVWLALSRLGDRCRKLLIRLYYPEEGQARASSYEEVAKEMGVPIGSIGPTRMRCLKKMKAEYEEIRGQEE